MQEKLGPRARARGGKSRAVVQLVQTTAHPDPATAGAVICRQVQSKAVKTASRALTETI